SGVSSVPRIRMTVVPPISSPRSEMSVIVGAAVPTAASQLTMETASAGAYARAGEIRDMAYSLSEFAEGVAARYGREHDGQRRAHRTGVRSDRAAPQARRNYDNRKSSTMQQAARFQPPNSR